MVVDGHPHGGRKLTTTCELPLRAFAEGAEITVEPFRAGAFPVICDLVVDRSALDRIIQAGGFVSVRTGSAPDGNVVPVPKLDAERALDAAACIGCGACVAACPNGSAALFAGAKLAHLGTLPQGRPERKRRALAISRTLDDEGFGGCSLHGECARACSKGIELDVIARMNGDVLRAILESGTGNPLRESVQTPGGIEYSDSLAIPRNLLWKNRNPPAPSKVIFETAAVSAILSPNVIVTRR